MLNKIVDVIIDRPINSKHPIHQDIIYELNYGYIPNTLGNDNKEIYAYVLGVNEKIDKFKGKVIAIIHRYDDEDKLIVSDKYYSKEDIYKLTYFQEKYFKSHIEMAYTTKEDILFDLKKTGLKNNDKLMIHSSLKSFGNIEGNDILLALKEYFNQGLVIFPTHTWAYIKEDNQIFDVNNTPSCVGMLTNLALKDKDFKRSLHPTHSVCAYGKNKEKYLLLDNNQNTPVSPTGCFGSLAKMNAKIVFLGAPLSKNTFIHSIEEVFNVPDRFTDKIYHFISKDNDLFYDYYMPRHFSTKRDHLSENYTKLLPHLIKHNIAYIDYIGNSKSVIIDAKECYLYVSYLLKNNLHIFDDDKEYFDDYKR